VERAAQTQLADIRKQIADTKLTSKDVIWTPDRGDSKFRLELTDIIPGYTCVQVKEPADHDTWDNNYLCFRQ
jgi:hypothetical protein